MQPGALMPAYVRAALVRRAIRAAPREICGFVLVDWSILDIDNVSEVDDAFHMDDDQLLAAYTQQYDGLLGIFHSHPSGSQIPSNEDIEGAPRHPPLRYWIVTLAEVIEWEMNPDDVPIRVA